MLLSGRATHLPHAAVAAATTERESGSVIGSRDVELTIADVSGVMMRPMTRWMRVKTGAHR
jgi:hypothetical protein